MLRVKVFSNGQLIGRSDLYASDPPMGCADGILRPADAYDEFLPLIKAIWELPIPDWTPLGLTLEGEDGTRLEAVGFTITDYAQELENEDERIVSAIGIGPSYERHFAEDLAYREYWRLG